MNQDEIDELATQAVRSAREPDVREGDGPSDSEVNPVAIGFAEDGYSLSVTDLYNEPVWEVAGLSRHAVHYLYDAVWLGFHHDADPTNIVVALKGGALFSSSSVDRHNEHEQLDVILDELIRLNRKRLWKRRNTPA